MHKQGHLKFIINPTLFSFPVFVIWKANAQDKKKSCAMVNIQKLNKLVLLDSYPLLLQSKIITNVQSCTNLAILDAISFFY